MAARNMEDEEDKEDKEELLFPAKQYSMCCEKFETKSETSSMLNYQSKELWKLLSFMSCFQQRLASSHQQSWIALQAQHITFCYVFYM